mgnify:CR=1 FL=1
MSSYKHNYMNKDIYSHDFVFNKPVIKDNKCKTYILYGFIVFSVLTFIAACVYSGFFAKDRITYLRMLGDVDCIQYSETNLTVIIPSNVDRKSTRLNSSHT